MSKTTLAGVIDDANLDNLAAKFQESRDRDVFEQIAKLLWPLMYAIALRLVGPNDAEDMVHNAFVKLYQTPGKYRAMGRYRSFCCTCVVNECLNWLKKRKREQLMDPNGIELPAQDSAHAAHLKAERNAEEEERLQRIEAALAKLSPEERVAYALRYIQGRDTTTAARILGISVSGYYSLIHRVSVKLRKAVRGETLLSWLLSFL